MKFAEEFAPAFKLWVTSMAGACNGKPHIDHSLKSKGSAKRKLLGHETKVAKDKNKTPPDPPQNDEGYDDFNASGQFDFLRATIGVPNMNQLKRLVIMIEKSSAVKVIVKRNRYYGKSPNKKDNSAMENGYRDVNFTLALFPNKFPSEVKNDELPKNFLVELQVNLNSVVRWKELPHSIYEATRQSVPFEDEHERQELIRKLGETLKELKGLGFNQTDIEKVIALKKAIENDKNWSMNPDGRKELIDISRFIYKRIFDSVGRRMEHSRNKTTVYEGNESLLISKEDIEAFHANDIEEQESQNDKQKPKELFKDNEKAKIAMGLEHVKQQELDGAKEQDADDVSVASFDEEMREEFGDDVA
jgi:hypothetical protein